jgi:type IV pilus assembly protein PilO
VQELQTRQYQKYFYNIISLYKEKHDLKIYLELILSLITIGIFVVFAIKPTVTTIADIVTKIKVEQETSDKLDIKIKNLGIAQTLYNAEKANINLLDTAIPSGSDISGFIRQNEGLIKKENVTPITVSVDKTNLLVATTSASVLGVTTSITGEFNNLENFIKDIESLRRPSIISKMNMSETDKLINLSLTLQTPYTK